MSNNYKGIHAPSEHTASFAFFLKPITSQSIDIIRWVGGCSRNLITWISATRCLTSGIRATWIGTPLTARVRSAGVKVAGIRSRATFSGYLLVVRVLWGPDVAVATVTSIPQRIVADLHPRVVFSANAAVEDEAAAVVAQLVLGAVTRDWHHICFTL